jgi:hypothetical protein
VVIGRGVSKEGAIPVSHSQVSEVWSRGSSIHKLARSRVTKGACAKARVVVVWRRRFTPGARCAGGVFVKDLWIGFVEGFSKEPKEPLRPEENLERSCADLGQRVGGLHHDESEAEFESKSETDDDAEGEDAHAISTSSSSDD